MQDLLILYGLIYLYMVVSLAVAWFFDIEINEENP
jgi:hypothetical protein